MKAEATPRKNREVTLTFTISLFLFTIYLFVYRGGFHSIDEVSIYSVTESLVKFGRLDTNQIAWTQWTTSQAEAQGFFGIDNQVYSKKGLALSLAQFPFYWLALHLPGLGMLQTVSLLNALITAITGSLIYTILRRMNFNTVIAMITALIYGLATISVIYAKYLFSEPLAGLLLLLTTHMLFVYRQKDRLYYLIVAGMAAGLTVLTRANNLFLIPVFGLYLLHIGTRSNLHRVNWRAIIAFIVSLAVPGLILLAYNALRTGNPLQTGYDLTLFSQNILLGVYKLLFSPLRGLFIYSPILFLSLPGWWLLRRTYPAEAWVFAGHIGITIGLFSAWSSGEGLSWGSRFLVPIIPFFSICLAPIIKQLLDKSTYAPLRFSFYNLLLLSLIIQILGLTINPWAFLAQLQADFGGEFFLENTNALYNFRYSQIVGQLRLWSVENSDLAWWQPWGFDGLAFGLSLGLILLAGWLLWRNGFGQTNHNIPDTHSLSRTIFRLSPHYPLMISIPLLICLAVTYFLLARYNQTDRQFGPTDDAYTSALQQIAAQTQPGEPVITVAQYHYHIPMNRFKAAVPLIGFAQQSWPLPDTALPLLTRAVTRSNIWLVTVGFPSAAPNNAAERWLAANTFKVSDEWFGDDVRVARFSAIQPTQIHPLNATFANSIRLTQVTLAPMPKPGHSLPVEFSWLTSVQPDSDYVLFLQLLDDDGTLLAQHDSQPNGGYAATSTWPINQPITSRHALALPRDIQPGAYHLIAGLYNPVTGQRLILDNDTDFVELGLVTIIKDTVVGS